MKLLFLELLVIISSNFTFFKKPPLYYVYEEE